MKEEYFSEEEMNAKIGKLVLSLRNFSNVPVGTVGKIVGGYQRGKKSGLDIEWLFVHQNRGKLIDGFSKDEYNNFLVELD